MQKKISANIIRILISSAFAFILIIISAIFLIRILGPTQIGRFISIYIIPSMLIRLSMLGSRKTAITHLVKNKYSDNEIVSSLLFLWLFSSTIAIVICMVNFAIMQHTDMNPLTHFIILAAIPLRLFIIYSITVFFGKTKFNFSSLFKLLPDVLNIIIIFFLIYTDALTVKGAILAYFLTSLLVAIICFLIITGYFKIKFEFNKQTIKELSSVGLITALTFFIMQLNYRFDFILLYKFATNYDVGIYALGTSFSIVIWLIPDAIGLVVKKKILNAKSFVSLKNETSGLLRISLLIGLFASFILYFIAPYIIINIFGNEFKESASVIRNMLPGVFFFIIFRTLNGFIHLYWNLKLIFKIFIPSLIVNIILNIYLIPLYGSIGAAWASNISYTLGAIVTLIVFSYKMKISLIRIFSFSIHDFSFLKKIAKIGTRKN